MINPEVDALVPPAPPPPPPFPARSGLVLAAGSKTRLTFTPYVLNRNSMDVDASRSFTVMLNPTELKHRRAITYNNERILGGVGKTVRFSTMESDTLDLAIVLDGTGVVPRSSARTLIVRKQLDELKRAIYNYDTTEKQPPVVSIIWGTTHFGGRLQSMSTRFTLFEPNGEPLRAMVDLSFIGSMDARAVKAIVEVAAVDSEIEEIVVQEGDTLEKLCIDKYGDRKRVNEVARLNNLRGLRELEPGTFLRLPPRTSGG